VGDVHLAAGQLREEHVALHHDGLAGRGRPAQAEQRGHRPFVHGRAVRQRGLLAVIDDREVEGARVLQRPPHDARAGHRPAVVGHRHAAGLAQVAVLRQLLAQRAAGDGADGVHADHAVGPRPVQDRARDPRPVVDGVGVGHRAYRGEPARGRGARAGGDRLLVLTAGLAQVTVKVDEARTYHEAPHVDGPAPSSEGPSQFRDPSVLDQDVQPVINAL
jgi:hypothetical protein